jgi:hypothetical protein
MRRLRVIASIFGKASSETKLKSIFIIYNINEQKIYIFLDPDGGALNMLINL